MQPTSWSAEMVPAVPAATNNGGSQDVVEMVAISAVVSPVVSFQGTGYQQDADRPRKRGRLLWLQDRQGQKHDNPEDRRWPLGRTERRKRPQVRQRQPPPIRGKDKDKAETYAETIRSVAGEIGDILAILQFYQDPNSGASAQKVFDDESSRLLFCCSEGTTSTMAGRRKL